MTEGTSQDDNASSQPDGSSPTADNAAETAPQPIPAGTPPEPIPAATPAAPIPAATPPEPIPAATPPEPIPAATPAEPIPAATPAAPIPAAPAGIPASPAEPPVAPPETVPAAAPVPAATPDGEPAPDTPASLPTEAPAVSAVSGIPASADAPAAIPAEPVRAAVPVPAAGSDASEGADDDGGEPDSDDDSDDDGAATGRGRGRGRSKRGRGRRDKTEPDEAPSGDGDESAVGKKRRGSRKALRNTEAAEAAEPVDSDAPDPADTADPDTPRSKKKAGKSRKSRETRRSKKTDVAASPRRATDLWEEWDEYQEQHDRAFAGVPATEPAQEQPDVAERREKRRKAKQQKAKRSKTESKEERATERELSRRTRRIKTPKASRAAAKAAARQAREEKRDAKAADTPKKKRKSRDGGPVRGETPTGRETVIIVDGSHVSIVLLRAGRVVGTADQEFENPAIAIESAAQSSRGGRLVWCNEIVPRMLERDRPTRSAPARVREARRAQSQIDAFGRDNIHLVGMLGNPDHPQSSQNVSLLSLGMEPRWTKHRLLRRHNGRVVHSGQCHGSMAGIWLRIGWATAELTWVGPDGQPLDWVQAPPVTLPPRTVGGEPPDVGSGVESLRASAATFGQDGTPRWVAGLVEQVDRQVQSWQRKFGQAETIWVHGPGAKTPGLIDALDEHARLQVQIPPMDVLPSVLDTDQIVTATNAWAGASFSDPRRVIAKAKRRRLMRMLRRGLYVALAVAALAGLSAWIGRGRDNAIAAADARVEAAQAAQAAQQAAAPPSTDTLIVGARNALGCASEAVELREIAAADPAAAEAADDDSALTAAVPVGYSPDAWPEGWHDVVIAAGEAPKRGIAGTTPHSEIGRAAVSDEIALAADLARQASEGLLPDGTTDPAALDSVFIAEGLAPQQWRTFAWAQTSFDDGRVLYTPPNVPALCAASGGDLLWDAQNKPLTAMLFARQMQQHPGWAISEVDYEAAETIALRQGDEAVSYEEFDVFVAWLAHQPDVAETLAPLAYYLWGDRGAVSAPEALTRRCKAGVHPQTGAELRLCGATASAWIGPSHLRPDRPLGASEEARQ